MKKILALALALMMVLSLAACGGNDKPAPSGGGTTDPGTQQTDPGTSQQEPSSKPDDSKPSGGTVDSAWNNAEYADYTNGVPEPELAYTITGASKVLGMNITFSKADEAQIDTWTQALVDGGFTLIEEDNYGVDTYENDTHTIEIHETSGAYILIK